MFKNRGFVLALLIGLIVVVADQASKQWAITALADSDKSLLGKFLTLDLTYNPGAAFSLGEGTTWIFALISVVAVVGLPILIRTMESRLLQFSLGAVWGGAVGNLIDRLFREPSFGQGHVVDFINYNGWFIGNVADIAVVVGMMLVLVKVALDDVGASRATKGDGRNE